MFTAIFSIWSLVSPSTLTTYLWTAVGWFHDDLNWFTIFLPLCFFLICMCLALSDYGRIKLGPKDSHPEFSTFSWMAMLFTAGIGVGLVNFGVADPIVHYQQSPLGLLSGISKAEAAKNALTITLFNWGIPAWSIYTISGLVIAYFTYHKNAKFLPSSPIVIGFDDKGWAASLGTITNIVAASAAALTMAATIGMGVFQIKNGLEATLEISLTGIIPSVIILIAIFTTYTLPALMPVKRGLKVLGDFNILIAIALLLFVFSIGPTRYFMELIVTMIGTSITELVPLSFNTYVFQDKGWFNDWTLTTLIWWVSWTPFMGVFIARISKGRTIREFVLASILIPSGFMVIWFSVFGGFGLLDDITGDGSIAKYIGDNPNDIYLSFIMVLQALPLFEVTGPVFVVLIVVFLATGATSAAIALSMMTSGGTENPPPRKTLIWCIIIATIAFATVATETLNGVKAVAIFMGIPYTFLLILQVSGFIRQIRHDMKMEMKK